MTYHLVGYLSFRATSACFLIPYYSKPDSNLCFTHEVDEAGRIEFFYEITLEGYHQEYRVPTEVNLAAGDFAHFAVRLSDGSILNGTALDLARQLRTVNLRKYGAPFFNVDAYTFIGDAMKRAKAINAAASLFKNDNARRSWRRRELNSQLLGLQRSRSNRPTGAFETEEIQHLKVTFHDRMWSRTWSNIWRSTRDENLRRVLQDIASSWLADFWTRYKPELVLAPLLYSRSTFARFYDLSLSALLSGDYSPRWVQVWSLLGKVTRKLSLNPQPIIATLGTHFLRAEVINNTKGLRISHWVQVFRGTVDEIGLTDEMINLSINYMEIYYNNFSFQKKILRPMFFETQDTNTAEYHKLRFLDLADVSNFWIEVFNSIKNPNTFLVLKSIEYLRNGNPMLSTWPTLWRNCGEYISLHEHQDIARTWVLKGTSQMKSWPEVVLALESDYFGDYEVQKALAIWVESHEAHPLYHDILGRRTAWKRAVG